jgi:energy-coupling factor transporter ATP-binding protein EcfA2
MAFIELVRVSFSYEGSPRPAIDSISVSIEEGEYVAIIGPNGSGKSSFLRLLVGLRVPQKGSVHVAGLDSSVPTNARAVRSALNLVFQSPPDQIVSTVVEEDVAFGPENLGVPRIEIAKRIDEALTAVGLEEERYRPPQFLSAGQQQRLAVAGALAMKGHFIAFDEATAMLDPAARISLLDLIDSLSAQGVGILHVTHDMTEAARARRILVMEEGRIVFDGSPDALFGGGERAGIVPPQAVTLARSFGLVPRASERAIDIASRLAMQYRSANATGGGTELDVCGKGNPAAADSGRKIDTQEKLETTVKTANVETESDVRYVDPRSSPLPAFMFEKVAFSYLKGTVNECRAVESLSFSLPRASLIALVGRTGSGKSTILQLMNALAFPSEGRILSLGVETTARGTELRRLRTTAPLAIQRPESALFEFYAGDDVAFGPRNLGLSGTELANRVREAMGTVGLPFMEFRDRPTRSLSGGEARRLALAGVIALNPEALLLDEPTSALDPSAKRTLLDLILAQRDAGKTVVIATHSMEEAAAADVVLVVDNGRIVAIAPPRDLFYDLYDPDWALGRPFACEVVIALEKAGIRLEGRPLTLTELIDELSHSDYGALSGADQGDRA